MSTKNFFEQWMKPEFSKSIPGVSNLPFDMKALMESNRKTFQAITEAQQLAVESFQTSAQRMTEIMSQMVQDQSEIARGIITEGTPEEKVARGAELVKRSYEKTIGGMREVGDIVNKSSREAGDIISKRVSSALNEITEVIEDQPKAAKKDDAKKSGKKAA
jgi:phasin family protein